MIDNYDFKEMEPQKYWQPPKNWTEEKKKETTRSRIFSGDWYGSEKKDGYFCKIIKEEDGTILLQSRTRGVNGEFPEKHEWVPHLNSFFDWLPNGTCLLGELYLPSSPGSSNITKILGCLQAKAVARQEKEKLHLYIFDVLAYNGISYIDATFNKRIELIAMLEQYTKNPLTNETDFPEVEIAVYYDGEELWKKLGRILEEGGEGIVMTRKDAKYQPNKRPSKDCQKVKKEIANTIDCFFTGAGTPPTKEYTGKEIEKWQYWLDLQTGEKKQGYFYKEYFEGAALEPITKPYFNGWVGSLEIGVVKNNKVVPIGYLSGVADELKSQPHALKGKTIEVSCMEILPTGGLRHAKMVQFRPDKEWKDCKWEDIFTDE